MNRPVPGVWFAALLACGISAFGCPYPSGADVRPRVLLVGGTAELLLSVAQGDPAYKITKVMVEYVITRGGQEVERNTVPAPITDPGAGQWVKDLSFPGPGRYEVKVSATVTSSKDGAPVPKSDTFPPIPVQVVEISLVKLEFLDTTDFKADSGNTVPAKQQQWPPIVETWSVFYYKQPKKLTINAFLKISDPLDEMKAMTITGEAGDDKSGAGEKFSHPFWFPANQTEFVIEKIEAKTYGAKFDYLEWIKWAIAIGPNKQDLGRTDNNIYYVPDGEHSGLHYDTILYNVCRPMKGMPPADNDTTLETIWGEFRGLQVRKFDRKTVMCYWVSEGDGDRDTVKKLIAGAKEKGKIVGYSGNCKAWADFLKACLELGGMSGGSIVTLVNADRPQFDRHPNDYAVVVKNVSVNPEGEDYGYGDYMWKRGPPDRPGYWSTVGSMPGQGGPGIPIEQEWPCHKVLEVRESRYYDPSYGKVGDVIGLENEILGGVQKRFQRPKGLKYFKPNTAGKAELREFWWARDP